MRACERAQTACLGGEAGAGDDDSFSLEKDNIYQPPYFVLYNLVCHLLWAVWYSVLKSERSWAESWLHLLLARTPLVNVLSLLF